MAGRTKLRKEIASKLKDDTLDMSYCELDEVPVRQIACISKARNLNLSNNNLSSLPVTFTALLQVVVLDLSRNRLRELPEHFGLMTQLRHLDLYGNQISRLPLSLGELKNLRWLDLKGNPLTEAVSLVAGPCNNMEDCQACARDIVKYLSTAKSLVEEERLRRLNNLADEAEKSSKKEGKKKRKKNVEKECKMDYNKTGASSQTEPRNDSTASLQHDNCDAEAFLSADAGASESYRHEEVCCPFNWSRCSSLGMKTVVFIIICHVILFFALLYGHWLNILELNPSLKNYHVHTKDLFEGMMSITRVQINSITNVVNDFIQMYFKGDV